MSGHSAPAQTKCNRKGQLLLESSTFSLKCFCYFLGHRDFRRCGICEKDGKQTLSLDCNLWPALCDSTFELRLGFDYMLGKSPLATDRKDFIVRSSAVLEYLCEVTAPD